MAKPGSERRGLNDIILFLVVRTKQPLRPCLLSSLAALALIVVLKGGIG